MQRVRIFEKTKQSMDAKINNYLRLWNRKLCKESKVMKIDRIIILRSSKEDMALLVIFDIDSNVQTEEGKFYG